MWESKHTARNLPVPKCFTFSQKLQVGSTSVCKLSTSTTTTTVDAMDLQYVKCGKGWHGRAVACLLGTSVPPGSYTDTCLCVLVTKTFHSQTTILPLSCLAYTNCPLNKFLLSTFCWFLIKISCSVNVQSRCTSRAEHCRYAIVVSLIVTYMTSIILATF